MQVLHRIIAQEPLEVSESHRTLVKDILRLRSLVADRTGYQAAGAPVFSLCIHRKSAAVRGADDMQDAALRIDSIRFKFPGDPLRNTHQVFHYLVRPNKNMTVDFLENKGIIPRTDFICVIDMPVSVRFAR